jgi:hypothetical protein
MAVATLTVIQYKQHATAAVHDVRLTDRCMLFPLRAQTWTT